MGDAVEEGDGVVSVARGRLDGVSDTVLLAFSHWNVIDHPEAEVVASVHREILKRLDSKPAEPANLAKYARFCLLLSAFCIGRRLFSRALPTGYTQFCRRLLYGHPSEEAMLTRCRLPHEFDSASWGTGEWSRSTSARWWLALIVLSMTMVSGCGGCTDDGLTEEEKAAAKEKLKKEKEKPKPDFEPPKLSIVPQKTDVAAIRLVKPGHWTAAVEEMKANNFDFVGQLYAEVRESGSGKVIDLDRTPHKLAIVRPATAEGANEVFGNDVLGSGQRSEGVAGDQLRSRGGSPVTSPGPEPLSLQKRINTTWWCCRPRPIATAGWNQWIVCAHAYLDGPLNYYQVVTPQIVKPLPLPSNSLAWTNIAYLVWDDVDPQMLSLEQQKAMVDWLHWGGQIIISGPKSLDQLRGKTFLRALLAGRGW